MFRLHRRISVLIGLLLVSCSSPQQPTYKMVSSVEDLMEGLVIPASDMVFEVGGISITKDGEQESAPKDDEEWALIKHNAMVLAEAGNLLRFEARAQEADWVTFSQALTDHATIVASKAESKDTRAVFDAAAAMYQQACTACHAKYLTEEPAP